MMIFIMDDDEPSGSRPERRKKRWGLRILLILLVLGGLGAAFWYTSSQNAQIYVMDEKDGMVEIERGVFFPMGTVAYSSDPAFAPIELPKGMKFQDQRFRDEGQLEEAVYLLLLDLSKRKLAQEPKEEDIRQARRYLRRAQMIPHLTMAQNEALERLQGDLDFAEGKLILEQVISSLRMAMNKFRIAQYRGTSRAEEAQEWAERIQRKLEILEQPLPPEVKVPEPPRFIEPAPAPQQAPQEGTRTEEPSAREEAPASAPPAEADKPPLPPPSGEPWPAGEL